MNLTSHRIDVNAYLTADTMPELVINRGDDPWRVAMGPVTDGQDMEWAVCKEGDSVLIPLVPYRLSRVPEQSLACMFSLGMSVPVLLQHPVAHLHMAYGTPVGDGSDHAEGQILFWLGFGVILA